MLKHIPGCPNFRSISCDAFESAVEISCAHKSAGLCNVILGHFRMCGDELLGIVYPEDVQNLREAHVVGLVHHAGDVVLVGVQALCNVSYGEAGLEEELLVNHYVLEAGNKALVFPGLGYGGKDGRCKGRRSSLGAGFLEGGDITLGANAGKHI